MTSLRALERYARRPTKKWQGPACELCAEPVLERHDHLVDLRERQLVCACRACTLLFSSRGDGRYRAVGDRVRRDPGLRAEAVATLGIPVGLAYVYRPSSLGRWVGFFPSPAGAMEAEISQDACAELARESPLFRAIEDDVEALLVRSERSGTFEAYLAPIDVCYQLVGLVRRHHRGFDGGDEAREAISDFFEGLSRRSRIVKDRDV